MSLPAHTVLDLLAAAENRASHWMSPRDMARAVSTWPVYTVLDIRPSSLSGGLAHVFHARDLAGIVLSAYDFVYWTAAQASWREAQRHWDLVPARQTKSGVMAFWKGVPVIIGPGLPEGPVRVLTENLLVYEVVHR